MDLTAFIEGIFLLSPRRFGTIAEIMIDRLFNLAPSNTLKYDSKDNDKRIEIKFSRALKKEEKLQNNNLIAICKNAFISNRMIKTDETSISFFDCNIQQVKPTEFDVLYYGIFFKDKIEIYQINSSNIPLLKNYSAKQHRGNEGEGQFHLNSSNIEEHRNKYLIKTLTYKQLYRLLE